MGTTNTKRNGLFKLIILCFTIGIVSIVSARLFSDDKSEARELNERTNKRNETYAKLNQYGFTDKNHTVAKPKGIFRIAVLGDSFIWGDGLPYENIWSHKLETKLSAEYDSIEVLHWGKNGWSTLDEFNFFKEHGKDYGVDLLLIGWVDNDPDMGNIKQIYPTVLKDEYPVLGRICPPLANKLMSKKQNAGYSEWISKIYAPKNLQDYGQLLMEFNKYLTEKNVPSIFVMTPSGYFDLLHQHFIACEPLIAKAGFMCLNLYNPTEKALSHYPSIELKANPMNGHPGVLMTEEFSTEVKAYLEANKYLDKVPKRAH